MSSTNTDSHHDHDDQDVGDKTFAYITSKTKSADAKKAPKNWPKSVSGMRAYVDYNHSDTPSF
jgi:hypothetical protein